LLYVAGEEVVDGVVITREEGTETQYAWDAVADSAWLFEDGSLQVAEEAVKASRVEAIPPPVVDKVEARIMDVAPTAAAALGLRAPAEATGRALPVPEADHVLILLLDGFGYVRYQAAVEAGDAPFLSSLEPPLRGITVYPPVTVVAMGSLLTGAPPAVHGIDQRGVGRSTEVETLFDVAAEAGLRVVAVEGEAVAFSLRNAELQLSGDRDGDGSTDDNVLANSMTVLETGMPDLLLVHFHGIDDAGHTVGPGVKEERAALTYVDGAVRQLVEATPLGTLVLILADHGQHLTADGGDHGHLIEGDMLIPIFTVVRTTVR
jgi:hypothetical protein